MYLLSSWTKKIYILSLLHMFQVIKILLINSNYYDNYKKEYSQEGITLYNQLYNVPYMY